MAVDLHPDIVRAIQEFSDTPLGRRYNRFTRKKYGMPGWKVQAKTVAGEFGGRSTKTGRKVVSSAGARGPGQFIASTRKDFQAQYGLDPWRSDQEAIEGMARHHLTRGGVRGYNPGDPNYEQYIMGQRLNSADRRSLRGRSAKLQGPGRTDVSLQSHTIPAQSFEAERQAERRGLLLGGDLDLKRLLEYKSSVSSLKDVPARRITGDLDVQRSPGQKFKVPVGASVNAPKGSIFEVFYDPAGQYWDSGGIHKGSIGGHGKHVHVAGESALLVALGRKAQTMGLSVGEHSKFGGRPSSGHVSKSFHYSDQAIDVSGGTPALRAKFARIVMQEARRRARQKH